MLTQEINGTLPLSPTLPRPQSHLPRSSKFESRIMLSSWKSLCPHVPEVPNQLLAGLPPLIADPSEANFKLELAPLVLFESFIIDSGTRDRVAAERHRHEFRDLHETLKILHSEGKAEFCDYAHIAREQQFQAEITDRVRFSVAAASNWKESILRAIDGWLARQEEMRSVLGQSFGPVDAIPHGPKIVLYEQQEKLRIQRAKHLRRLLLRSPKNTEIPNEIQTMVRAYLGYINCNLLLAEHFDCPVFDWPNFDSFYRMKIRIGGSPEPLQLRERGIVKRLFSVSVPDFQPLKGKEFLRMLNDKRLALFRQKIRDWAIAEKLGVSIPDYVGEVQKASQKLVNAYASQSKLTAWGIVAAKYLSLVPTLHYPMIAIENSLEAIRDRRISEKMTPFQWYFFTQSHLRRNDPSED